MNCYEDEMPVPSMGESYLVIVSYFCLKNVKKVKKKSFSQALLNKLQDIKWNTITDINNLPNLPQNFNRKRIFIEDDGELVIPMETLKNKR